MGEDFSSFSPREPRRGRARAARGSAHPVGAHPSAPTPSSVGFAQCAAPRAAPAPSLLLHQHEWVGGGLKVNNARSWETGVDGDCLGGGSTENGAPMFRVGGRKWLV